jgi:hypothetical protein
VRSSQEGRTAGGKKLHAGVAGPGGRQRAEGRRRGAAVLLRTGRKEGEQVDLGWRCAADLWLLGIGGVGGDGRQHELVRCRKGVGLSWRELCCWTAGGQERREGIASVGVLQRRGRAGDSGPTILGWLFDVSVYATERR